MFNKEFFPTPIPALEQMGIDCFNKICLEPQAGKGDIVDYLKSNGAKEVVACELNNDLKKILSGKCRLIEDDFFHVKAEQISHVQLIVMNPPFSNAGAHILHAWEIAPEGCEIISLCNWETINNSYSSTRRELERVIEDYGDKSVNLGKCFDTAERKTNIEVGLIKLFKPVTSSQFDYEGFYMGMDNEVQADGIMEYNDVRAVVNSYVAAVNCFDKHIAVAEEMNRYTRMVGFGGGFSFSVSYNKDVTTKEDFAKEMQRSSWKYIFGKMNLNKYVTSGVMQDINKFIETQSRYPFTMKNIYKMFEIIVGTKEQTMNRAIEEAIDNITRHTHENRYNVEGWKTNSGHLLNKKFILDWMVESRSYNRGMSLRYNSNGNKLDDLTKALCYITGRNFSEITSIAEMFSRFSEVGIMTNRWYNSTMFEFKCFKKGTLHVKFRNDDDWEILNKTYAKIKGQVLPESFKNAA